ncbi:T6SS immunity protein Tli3 family protein [Caballeronia sp. DA-9]|uniref:T6SS immunity protein Tli3 family protein n=1 Tax=Caballeronia sp. DA-9 TaxID=3436237 RepID=UPI003F6748E7
MKRITFMSLLIAVLTLAGCQTDYEDMTAAQRSAYTRTRMSYIFKPDPNAAIQVTYRIDDSRFFTLENYDRCYGDNYFNNTTLGIHQKVWTGDPRGYRGRVVVDDRSGMNVVLPTAENRSCGDRGCTSYFAYSTDSGRTFKWLDYLKYTSLPSEASKKYTIAVTKDAIYIADKSQYDTHVTKLPLTSQIELDKPYPSGLRSDSAWEANKKILPAGLRTPSGQDHFTCDGSIRSAGQPKTP